METFLLFSNTSVDKHGVMYSHNWFCLTNSPEPRDRSLRKGRIQI